MSSAHHTFYVIPQGGEGDQGSPVLVHNANDSADCDDILKLHVLAKGSETMGRAKGLIPTRTFWVRGAGGLGAAVGMLLAVLVA